MKLTDQTGQTHFFTKVPDRIVSLVPSHTDTLFDLGLGEKIVGITKFCVHPAGLKKTKTIVGGTKNVNFRKIEALKPDIILCNKEENTREIVLELQKICPVWTTDVGNIADNEKMISGFGILFGATEVAQLFIDQINEKIKTMKHNQGLAKTVAYCIWKNPWMVAGAGTYIDSLLKINNLKNAFENHSCYPQTDLENLANLKLDYLLLSSEPYPFNDKDMAEIQQLMPNTICRLVDGEMFSWHGTRLLKALEYFEDLKF